MMVRIEETSVRNVITKSNLPVGDYSVNPYTGCTHACRYCYACFMKRFTNHQEPWGDFLDVKKWPEIDASKYVGKKLFIGSVTDPYNPQEKEYGRTRALLEQLSGHGVSVSIATKSDLVLRDLDLIKEFPDARVSWSINTLDEEFRRDMDKAVSIERRLNAMGKFHDAGVRTTCFISPIFPGITDPKEIVLRTKDRCNLVWLENLNLRGSFSSDIMRYISDKHPNLVPLYDSIYRKKDRTYWRDLDEEMGKFSEELGLEYLRADDTRNKPFDAPPTIVNYFFHEEVKYSAKR